MSNDKIQIIPAGTLFVITRGEYSDYSVRAMCVAKVDIDADRLRAEYLELYPEQREAYNFEDGKFIAFMAGKGLFEEVEYMELHTTDYARADEMWVKEMK